MLLPSKVTPYTESVFSKMPAFLRQLEYQDMAVLDLFNAVQSDVLNVGEFIEVLDCLYALKKVEISPNGSTLRILKEGDESSC